MNSKEAQVCTTIWKPGQRVWLHDINEKNLVLGEVLGLATSCKGLLVATAFKRVIRKKGAWKFCTATLQAKLDIQYAIESNTKDITYIMQWVIQSSGPTLKEMRMNYDLKTSPAEEWVLKTSSHEANYR